MWTQVRAEDVEVDCYNLKDQTNSSNQTLMSQSNGNGDAEMSCDQVLQLTRAATNTHSVADRSGGCIGAHGRKCMSRGLLFASFELT